jgi:phage-related minor tail protein
LLGLFAFRSTCVHSFVSVLNTWKVFISVKVLTFVPWFCYLIQSVVLFVATVETWCISFLWTGTKIEGILRQSADVEEVERRVQEYEQGTYKLLTDFSLD